MESLRVSVLAGALCVLLVSTTATAQIKQPGAHRKYSVEIEPHGVLWWHASDYEYWDAGGGWGLGLRAAIPIMENGFVPSINNSAAIGFGLDWGHFKHNCRSTWFDKHDTRYYSSECNTNSFWAPVVLQWNFYITKAFSVFGEPGLAINYTRWTWGDGQCLENGGWAPCTISDHAFNVDPVFFVGGRVGGEKVSFTFRLGWPYASVGASFFL
jgi:hypothetical protein